MDHPDKDARLTYFQSKLKALLFWQINSLNAFWFNFELEQVK